MVRLARVYESGYFRAAGRVAEQRSEAKNEEEELVRRYVVNNAEVPEKVEFLRWGPHMYHAEIRSLLEEAGILELAQVFGEAKASDLKKLETIRGLFRVQYRIPTTRYEWDNVRGRHVEVEGPKETRDSVFLVVGKMVLVIEYNNTDGDAWKREFRRALARRFPAIDVDP